MLASASASLPAGEPASPITAKVAMPASVPARPAMRPVRRKRPLTLPAMKPSLAPTRCNSSMTRAIGVENRTGGENDESRRRQDDERQHREAQATQGRGGAHQFRLPAPVGIEAQARDFRLEHRLEGVEVGGPRLVDPDRDQGRQRKFVDVRGFSEPRLEQLAGVITGQPADAGDTRRDGKDGNGLLHLAVEAAARQGPDLNRNFGGDTGGPLRHRRLDQHESAQRQGGKITHYGHRQGERPHRRGSQRNDVLPFRHACLRMPFSSIITPALAVATSLGSWVAITTVVPKRLSS